VLNGQHLVCEVQRLNKCLSARFNRLMANRLPNSPDPKLSIQLQLRSSSMKYPSDMAVSPLRRQAAEALRRARKLPVGSDRNELRQLAVGLRFLDEQRRKGSRLDLTGRDGRASGNQSADCEK
jgi:hypothetical protein